MPPSGPSKNEILNLHSDRLKFELNIFASSIDISSLSRKVELISAQLTSFLFVSDNVGDVSKTYLLFIYESW